VKPKRARIKNEKAKEVSKCVKLDSNAVRFKCSSSAAIASTSNVAGPEEDVGLSSPAARNEGPHQHCAFK
jgi:hypothetical protein